MVDDRAAGSRTWVVLLAGGDVSAKFRLLRAQCRCPALLPVHTRPLAACAMNYYLEDPRYHCLLAVDKEYVDEVRLELPPEWLHYQLVGVEPERGVIATLAQVLEIIPDDPSIVVNVVTTVPTVHLSDGEVLVDEQPEGNRGWAHISERDGRLEFRLKTEAAPEESHAFTGVFRTTKHVLTDAIKTVSARDDLLALLVAADVRWRMRYGPWIDFGHEEHYADSRAMVIESRSFNSVSVDRRCGVLTKTSRNDIKLRQELQYYDMLPRDLAIYFPRIVSSEKLETGERTYTMEYYGYPTLAEYQLYWDLPESDWRRVFAACGSLLDSFRRHRFSIGRRQFEHFIWGKTEDRLREYLRRSPESAAIVSEPITLNGRSGPSGLELLARAKERVVSLYCEDDFCVYHGDFCFSNILFDLQSGVMRVIDPRGSFGDQCEGVFGDRKYDIAKLAHSAVGHYDHIVNGLFHCEGSGTNQYELHINRRDNAPVLERWMRHLCSAQSVSWNDIRLLEALLFLGMLPLHGDSPRRQQAFLLNGIGILREVLT